MWGENFIFISPSILSHFNPLHSFTHSGSSVAPGNALLPVAGLLDEPAICAARRKEARAVEEKGKVGVRRAAQPERRTEAQVADVLLKGAQVVDALGVGGQAPVAPRDNVHRVLADWSLHHRVDVLGEKRERSHVCREPEGANVMTRVARARGSRVLGGAAYTRASP